MSAPRLYFRLPRDLQIKNGGVSFLCFCLFFSLVVLAGPGFGQTTVRSKLKVPYSSFGPGLVPLWMAKDKGLFARQQLDVELLYIATSPTIIQTMLSGEVQLSSSGQEAAMGANLAGGDIVIIATGVDRPSFFLFTIPEITKVEQLKGRRLGISRAGSSTDFAMRFLLQKYGLNPKKDVRLVPTGGIPKAPAAMQAGVIEGALLSPPITLRARKLGFRELLDPEAIGFPFYSASVTARKSWLDSQPDLARRFIKAYVEAIAAIHKDKPSTLQVIAKYTKEKEPEGLEEGYRVLQKSLPRVPEPSLDAIRMGLNILAETKPEAASADPSRFIDTRFVRELKQSGYIDSLYK
ncbi:MAG: ABC transporter substrate-binding protein [Deltaproteobacteria bacterium]|nr:ABC transporter substrate-binding protein [Deltaproteobacteria bacterium]